MSQGALHWPSRRRLFHRGGQAQRLSGWWAGAVLVVAVVSAGLSVALA